MPGRTEEAATELDRASDQVLTQVCNKVKAEYLTKQIKDKSTSAEIKEVFGDVASIGSSPDLKLSATVLPGVGFAPRAIGVAFGLQTPGELSAPIADEVGVVVVKLNAITPASEIADYSRYQNQLTENSSQRTAYMIMMAMEELANVKDMRYKFF